MKKLFSVLLIAISFFAMSNGAFSQVTTVPAGSGPYTTLGAAFTAINAGGVYAGVAVTVNINANTSETIAILNGGVFTSCLIRPTASVTVSSASADAIIVLDGADNVTIDGRIGGTGTTISLTLNNSNTTLNAGSIRMSNGSTANVVKYVKCVGFGNAASGGGRTINIAQSALDAQGGNNNNTIEDCLVDGGRRGLQVFGTAPAGGQLGVLNENNIFRRNIVKHTTSLGIFIGSETKNTTCEDNQVFNDAPVNIGAGLNYRGINCQGTGVNTIQRNRVHDLTSTDLTSTYFGILLIPVTPTAPASSGPPTTTLNVNNNSITLMTTSNGQTVGMDVSNIDLAYTGNIYYNTLRVGGSYSASGVAVYSGALTVDCDQAGSILNIKNNIANNSKAGDSSTNIGLDLTVYPLTDVTLNSDYNLANGPDDIAGWDAGYAGFIFKNGGIEFYKMVTCPDNVEQNTAFKNANFTGTNDSHLGLVGGDLEGAIIPGVTTDIDGQTRSSTHPYRGCDEKTDPLKVMTLGCLLEGVTTQDQISVTLVNTGCAIRSTCTSDLSAAGVSTLCYGDSIANGTAYWVYAQGQRSILTSSAATQSFGGGTLSYDFRTAQNKAYNGNMVPQGSSWALFGGNVVHDDCIELADNAEIDNATFNFESGCRLPTDVNNDGTVDLTDGAIADNNTFNFVCQDVPCAVSPTSAILNRVTSKSVSKNILNSNSFPF